MDLLSMPMILLLAPPYADSEGTLNTVMRFYTALILIKKLIPQQELQWSCGVN